MTAKICCENWATIPPQPLEMDYVLLAYSFTGRMHGLVRCVNVGVCWTTSPPCFQFICFRNVSAPNSGVQLDDMAVLSNVFVRRVQRVVFALLAATSSTQNRQQHWAGVCYVWCLLTYKNRKRICWCDQRSFYLRVVAHAARSKQTRLVCARWKISEDQFRAQIDRKFDFSASAIRLCSDGIGKCI